MTDLFSSTALAPVKARVWSPQQLDFFEWCSNGQGSALVIAVAGAGKTTILIEGCKRIAGKTALMVFNKKNAIEFEERLANEKIDPQRVKSGTVHSFGRKALVATLGNTFKTNTYKTRDIVQALFGRNNPYAPVVVKLVELAKNRAVGIVGSIDDRKLWHDIIEHYNVLQDLDNGVPANVVKIIDMSIAALNRNNEITDTIDFNDMIYLPILMGCAFEQFDNVFVDEAQDSNLARICMIKAMLKKGGRVAAVGDPAQAIYGFTGAEAEALETIEKDFSCVRLPLTVSYRCPQAVVEFARQWHNHIEAHPDAPMGSVSECDMEQFLQDAPNADKTSTAVLCRTNKQLVALAFRLIRNRIPCRVEGREIGQGLVKLATKWKRPQDLIELTQNLEKYLDDQTTLLLAKGKEDQVQAIEDQVETLKVIIEDCQHRKLYGIDDLVKVIQDLFGEGVTDMIVLSSIHKAKGREWNTVYWLDRAGTCPSKWARQVWQQEQEKNLCYVAATRSKDRLIDIVVSPPLAE